MSQLPGPFRRLSNLVGLSNDIDASNALREQFDNVLRNEIFIEGIGPEEDEARRKAVLAKIREICPDPGKKNGGDASDATKKAREAALAAREANPEDWATSYRIEQLLVHLMDDEKLKVEARRRIADLRQLEVDEIGEYETMLGSVIEMKPVPEGVGPEEKAAAEAERKHSRTVLRKLVARMVNDAQWGFLKRSLVRKYWRLYAKRNLLAFLGCGFVLLVVMFIAQSPPLECTTTAGAGVETDTARVAAGDPTGVAGLPGAEPAAVAPPDPSLPPLPSGAPPEEGASTDTANVSPRGGQSPCNLAHPRLGFTWGVWLAFATGVFGAAFSMIIRASDLLNDADIDRLRVLVMIPFILLRLGVGAGAAVILYFAVRSGLLEGNLWPDLTAIGFAAAKKTEADFALNAFVPNTHLAALMVWSFVAGFSEKLVPNILNRLEKRSGSRKEG